MSKIGAICIVLVDKKRLAHSVLKDEVYHNHQNTLVNKLAESTCLDEPFWPCDVNGWYSVQVSLTLYCMMTHKFVISKLQMLGLFFIYKNKILEL